MGKRVCLRPAFHAVILGIHFEPLSSLKKLGKKLKLDFNFGKFFFFFKDTLDGLCYNAVL